MRPLRIISLLLALCICAGSAIAQEGTKEQRSRMERLEKEIAILDRQIKDNTAKNADALARLSLLQTKIKTRQSIVDESDKRIKELNGSIRSKQAEIDKMQAKLDTMTAWYGRLVHSAYKNRDARVWYMYILSSENIGQGMRRYSYFRNLSTQMNEQAALIKEAKAALGEEKASLEKMRDEAKQLRAAQARELASLKTEEAQVKKLSTTLSRQKTKYQKDLASKKKQAEALEREIKRAIAAAMGKADSKGTAKPSKPIDYKLADEFKANKGKLPWPANGAVTAHFGKQYHSVFKKLDMPYNNGINIALPEGSEVATVFNGTVAQITVLPGYHQCILVQHGNFFTLYAKVKNVYVKAGDKVTTGQKLGTVDTIAGETVFHFEIWNEKTQPQNPESWLRPR